MGKGEDKIARSLLDLQPTAILEFYRIFPDVVNKPLLSIDIHGGSIFKHPITWQGVKYLPVPIEAEGFELTANGKLPRPKIRVANKDFLVTSLLQNNKDFKNAEIIRKRTFVKYIDDSNFDAGNPFGDADSTAEISEEKYVIGQKTEENRVFVEFELTSPLDLENFEVNHRRILGKYCYWTYRGAGCRYQGPPINQEDGEGFKRAGTGESVVPLSSSDEDEFIANDPRFLWQATRGYKLSDVAYLENPKILINDVGATQQTSPSPMKIWYVCVSGNTGQRPEDNPTYWAKDGCNKKISSCKLRFNDETIKYEESFGLAVDEDAVIISGSHIQHPGTSTDHAGILISESDELTGLYTNADGTNSDWTIALFADFINSVDEAGGYLDTRTGWRNASQAWTPPLTLPGAQTANETDDGGKFTIMTWDDGWVFAWLAVNRADGVNDSLAAHFNIRRFSRRKLIVISYNSTDKELKTYNLDKSGQYENNIVPPANTYNLNAIYERQGGADLHWKTNCFSLGSNLNYSNPGQNVLTSRDAARYSAQANYIGCAVWKRELAQDEVGILLENINEREDDENNQIAAGSPISTFRDYNRAPSSLTGDDSQLVAWWQGTRFPSESEQGSDGGATFGGSYPAAKRPVFLDAHGAAVPGLTPMDLSGYHDVYSGTKKLMRPETVTTERTVQYYHLPFGGFPGTDGFTYQA